MNEPTTIPKRRERTASLNYTFLMREGIRLAQQLSGDIWTDYNDHDPGVTILEQLNYALTELAFKAHLSIEDIFQNTKENPFKGEDYVLFRPDQIFPFSPLTANDYRHLIIDHIPEVQNAWVIPQEQSKLGFNVEGLYKVLLQLDYSEEGDWKARQKEIVQKTKVLLSEHRSLCEDIDQIIILTPKKVTVEATVSVESDVIGESLLAEIAYVISEVLTPTVQLSSLEEALEKGDELTELLKRPVPKHGFIANEDLLNSRQESIGTIHKSTLIRRITDIRGVDSVDAFSLIIDGKKVEKEVFIFEQEFEDDFLDGVYLYPILDIKSVFPDDNKSGGILLKTGNEFDYQVNYAVAKYTYDVLGEQYKARYYTPLNFPAIALQNTISNEQISYFHSIQNTFPEVYGVGKYGLPNGATPARKAHAKQLQGYLILFEQVMVNYLAQLSNAYQLFSVKQALDTSYFYQLPINTPNLKDLIEGSKVELLQQLKTIGSQFDPANKRRNQFLDHLLARFGEEFLHESFNVINQNASGEEEEDFQATTIQSKLNFLQDYVAISQNRGKGYDYLKPYSYRSNVSGLQKRITYLFNLNESLEGSLTKVTKTPKFKATKVKTNQQKIGRNNVFFFDSENINLQKEVLRYGILKDSYEIDKDTFEINFTNPSTLLSNVIYQGTSLENSEERLQALIAFLKELNAEADNFYLIEHILLRPVDDRRFCFYFIDRSRKLLKSIPLYEDQKEWFIQQLNNYTKKRGNYEIQKEGDSYTLYLKNDDGNAIAYIDGFIDEERAKKALDTAKIQGLLNKSFSEQIHSEEILPKGGNLGTDPYSMTASILLPNWTARFQNKELKQLLEEMIYQNAPAHIKLNFYWLGMSKMAHIEKYYQKWLEEKRLLEPRQPLLDNLSFFLWNLLESYKRPNDRSLARQLQEMESDLEELLFTD